MSSPNIVDPRSGNVYMIGTPEYNLQYAYKHKSPAEYKKLLNAYRAKHGAQNNTKKTRKNRKHGGKRSRRNRTRRN